MELNTQIYIMSTSYVIPDITTAQVLQVLQADDDIIVIDNGDDYIVEMPIDPSYSLQKRMALARFMDVPGDDIQQGSNKASVFLSKTDDVNCWFMGYATSIRQPELILDRIIELLDAHGIEASWISEHDEGYFELLDDAEDEDHEEG